MPSKRKNYWHLRNQKYCQESTNKFNGCLFKVLDNYDGTQGFMEVRPGWNKLSTNDTKDSKIDCINSDINGKSTDKQADIS